MSGGRRRRRLVAQSLAGFLLRKRLHQALNLVGGVGSAPAGAFGVNSRAKVTEHGVGTPLGLGLVELGLALVSRLLRDLRGPLGDLRGLLPDPVHESHGDSPFSPSSLPQQHHSPIPLPRPATQPGRWRTPAGYANPPMGSLRRSVVPEISSLPWSRRQLHWQRRGMSASGAALSRLASEEAAP